MSGGYDRVVSDSQVIIVRYNVISVTLVSFLLCLPYKYILYIIHYTEYNTFRIISYN